MATTRVEDVLDAIACLSAEEKTALVRALPIALRNGAHEGHLSTELLEEIHDAWEQMRLELRARGRRLGSVSDELEMLRDERDAQLARRQVER
jgi:hypothetical protein